MAEQQALWDQRYGAGSLSQGGTRTASSRAPAMPAMSPEEVYSHLKKDPTDEDVAAGVRASGGQVVKVMGEDGVGVPMRDSPVWQESLERLRRLRTMSAPDGDKLVKAESEARQNDAETNLLKRAGAGDKDAATGLLANKGQGEHDSLNGGVGTYSRVRGDQSLNAVGTSAAGENAAQSKKYLADAEKTIAEGRDALADAKGGKSSERLSSQLNSVAATVKMMLDNKPSSKAGKEALEDYQRTLDRARKLQADLLAAMEGNLSGQAAPAPGPAAQSRAPAPAPRRLTYDPKTGTFK